MLLSPVTFPNQDYFRKTLFICFLSSLQFLVIAYLSVHMHVLHLKKLPNEINAGSVSKILLSKPCNAGFRKISAEHEAKTMSG